MPFASRALQAVVRRLLLRCMPCASNAAQPSRLLEASAGACLLDEPVQAAALGSTIHDLGHRRVGVGMPLDEPAHIGIVELLLALLR